MSQRFWAQIIALAGADSGGGQSQSAPSRCAWGNALLAGATGALGPCPRIDGQDGAPVNPIAVEKLEKHWTASAPSSPLSPPARLFAVGTNRTAAPLTGAREPVTSPGSLSALTWGVARGVAQQPTPSPWHPASVPSARAPSGKPWQPYPSFPRAHRPQNPYIHCRVHGNFAVLQHPPFLVSTEWLPSDLAHRLVFASIPLVGVRKPWLSASLQNGMAVAGGQTRTFSSQPTSVNCRPRGGRMNTPPRFTT